MLYMYPAACAEMNMINRYFTLIGVLHVLHSMSSIWQPYFRGQSIIILGGGGNQEKKVEGLPPGKNGLSEEKKNSRRGFPGKKIHFENFLHTPNH